MIKDLEDTKRHCAYMAALSMQLSLAYTSLHKALAKEPIDGRELTQAILNLKASIQALEIAEQGKGNTSRA